MIITDYPGCQEKRCALFYFKRTMEKVQGVFPQTENNGVLKIRTMEKVQEVFPQTENNGVLKIRTMEKVQGVFHKRRTMVAMYSIQGRYT
jgi:hypothetical protein